MLDFKSIFFNEVMLPGESKRNLQRRLGLSSSSILTQWERGKLKPDAITVVRMITHIKTAEDYNGYLKPNIITKLLYAIGEADLEDEQVIYDPVDFIPVAIVSSVDDIACEHNVSELNQSQVTVFKKDFLIGFTENIKCCVAYVVQTDNLDPCIKKNDMILLGASQKTPASSQGYYLVRVPDNVSIKSSAQLLEDGTEILGKVLWSCHEWGGE